MKKTILMLIVLLLVTPAMATVKITCEDAGGGQVNIYYDRNDEVELVRAFGLDIVATDANIIDVNNVNPDYRIYPGTIYIVDGNVIDWGSPVAPANAPGVSTSGVTIEAGSLYEAGDANLIPDPCGLLCTITVDGDCDISITTNNTRGGVVLEDATSADVNSPGCTVQPGPACWSYDCFDCGDMNGDCGHTFDDITILIAGWPPNPYDPCADLNKDGGMTFDDITILINHWPPGPGCTPCGACTPIP